MSQLCYAIEIWSSGNNIELSIQLERVQRRAMKWVLVNSGELSYKERLLALDLLPLTYVTACTCLCLFMRIIMYFFMSITPTGSSCKNRTVEQLNTG